MRIGAVDAAVVRGVLAAFVLAAVPSAAPGPALLHASQPPQQQPAAAPEEQPVETDAAQDAATPEGEQPPDTDEPLADQPDAAEAAPPAGAADEQPTDPDAEPPPDPAEAEQPAGTFEAPAGLILSYVRSEGSGDFERVMARLGAALAASDDEQSRELLAGWSLYRAREPGPEGEILYVLVIDPAVAGADYAVPELLGAVLPDESQALFEAFSAAFGSGQALINLEPVELVPASPE